MKYFVKHVNTYRKFTKTQKGQAIEKIVQDLEHIVLEDRQTLVQLNESICHVVHKLNNRFPKTSEWKVTFSGGTYIVIRPAGPSKVFGELCSLDHYRPGSGYL